MTTGEKPELIIKPRYVASIVILRTIFFLFFGAAFFGIASMAVTSISGAGEENFGRVIPVVICGWTALYLTFIFGIVPGRYSMSSYRFYSDRVEFEAGTVFSMESRSIVYARIIETGCVKGMLQLPRKMGNIVLKVAAAGANPGAQSTVLQDNLVMTDIENPDENLEKIREIVNRKK